MPVACGRAWFSLRKPRWATALRRGGWGASVPGGCGLPAGVKAAAPLRCGAAGGEGARIS